MLLWLVLCIPGLALAAGSSGSGIGFGPGIGFTDIYQTIPGESPIKRNGTSLQFTYFNMNYQQMLPGNWALSVYGIVGTELFSPDGALLVPDKDVTIFDVIAELRWPMFSDGSLTKNFSPYWFAGFEYNGLPVLGMRTLTGPLQFYTMERLLALWPVGGVGTGLYFSNSSLSWIFRTGLPFSGGSKFKIDNGIQLTTQIDYNFVLGKMGNIGIELWGRRAWLNFEQTDPITRGEFNNKYLYSGWGLKGYYRFVF